MRRYKIYINDPEPRYGGKYYMETISAESYNQALERAEELYGEGAIVEEVRATERGQE